MTAFLEEKSGCATEKLILTDHIEMVAFPVARYLGLG